MAYSADFGRISRSKFRTAMSATVILIQWKCLSTIFIEKSLLPRLVHGHISKREFACWKIRRNVFPHFIIHRPLPSVLFSAIFVLNTLLHKLTYLSRIYGSWKDEWSGLHHCSSPRNARASITWVSIDLSGDPAIVS